MENIIDGNGVVQSIGYGKLIVIKDEIENYISNYVKDNKNKEIEIFEKSIDHIKKDLEKLVDKFYQQGKKEQAEIMEAHLIIVNDPELIRQTTELIEDGSSAPKAIYDASKNIAQMFEMLDDDYLKERAADVKDVGKRIAKKILGVDDDLTSINENVILCGNDIEPSILVNIPEDKIKGIILGMGSTTSHTVIIAKSREIATIVGVGQYIDKFKDGSNVIINGYEGRIILDPSEETLESYKTKIYEEKKRQEYYLSLKDLPAITKDGKEVLLAANVGNEKDIDNAIKYGCKGVGLFRTEFIYMSKNTLPTEEEQFSAYKYVVENCKNDMCIIRTMDIGGDKKLNSIKIDREDNPFLGWRAVRISLELTDIFKSQIKAILRASTFGKVGIMIPMIISVDELISVKEIINECKEELKKENIAYSNEIQIGIMIETPAAVIMADELAKECDFFSIGTNDLVQYTLAVDRGNVKVSNLYSPFNPAVIRSIHSIINAAHSNNIWVGMCGEMAGDPMAVALLVSMGIDELSMSAPSIPKVKEIVREITADDDLVQKIIKLDTKDKIINTLETYINDVKK